MSMTKINYVGKVYETERYGKFTVIKDLGLHQLYENNPQRFRLLEIQWENTGSTLVIRSSQLSTLNFKDKYAKTVCGVGCLGDAENYTKKEYDIWYQMLRRCYNPSCPDYVNYGAKSIRVCTRWLNLANFLEDLKKMRNYDKLMAGERYELDKDLLQVDVPLKIYSPETCQLVKPIINNSEVFLRNLDNKDVKYNGVYDTQCVGPNKGYIARICLNGKKCNLGTFDAPIYAAAYRDHIASLYGRLELMNHTGVTVEEALQHRRARYNSISDIRTELPPVEMCEIVDNSYNRDMCRRVKMVEKDY